MPPAPQHVLLSRTLNLFPQQPQVQDLASHIVEYYCVRPCVEAACASHHLSVMAW